MVTKLKSQRETLLKEGHTDPRTNTGPLLKRIAVAALAPASNNQKKNKSIQSEKKYVLQCQVSFGKIE